MTKRPIITFSNPDHPMPDVAPVASPDVLATAHYLICRRATDEPPFDVSKEWHGYCCDCGEPIIRASALPNQEALIICIYCWHNMATRQ